MTKFSILGALQVVKSCLEISRWVGHPIPYGLLYYIHKVYVKLVTHFEGLVCWNLLRVACASSALFI